MFVAYVTIGTMIVRCRELDQDAVRILEMLFDGSVGAERAIAVDAVGHGNLLVVVVVVILIFILFCVCACQLSMYDRRATRVTCLHEPSTLNTNFNIMFRDACTCTYRYFTARYGKANDFNETRTLGRWPYVRTGMCALC